MVADTVMMDIHGCESTLVGAYHNAIRMVRGMGDVVPCPDWNTSRLELSYSFRVVYPLSEPRISKLIPCGPYELEQYRQEMLDGILDFEVARGNWHYTYHQRMESQIKFVVDELRRNPYSTRAVIDIRTPDDRATDNPACLQHIQYFVRHEMLVCKALFRSNDLLKATFMNAYALICLQERIANELGLEVGPYTHTARSLHVYEQDWPLLDSYCERLERAKFPYTSSDVTYTFDGDWDEQMEEAKPAIAKMVESLKNERK